MFRKNILLTLVLLISSHFALALPIDWNGSLSVDTTRIDNYSRSEDAYNGASGSQAINENGNSSGALFQTYIFKLNPHIIINDGVSVKGQLTTGSQMGGYLGDNTTVSSSRGLGAGLSYNTTPAGNSNLDINQMYIELYADSALYKVGRFTKHWGLGAVINEGNRPQDRFLSLYDGLEIEYNFGKFYIVPYWAKLYTGSSLTRNTAISELGAHFLYDNDDKDVKLGILYTKRQSGGGNNQLVANDPDSPNGTSTHAIGQSEFKLIDVYIEKNINKLSLKAEIPLVSGSAGKIYDSNNVSSYSAKSFIFDIGYDKSPTFNYGLTAGVVSGDDATTNSFEASYLHPNYQIAQLMFRYNLDAIGDNQNYNIFDSYVTNATFAKLYFNFIDNNWKWNLSFIYGKANETAKSGQSFYHHERGYKVTTAVKDQSDDLGMEIDASFDYQWNSNVVLSGFFGYFKVGDYYKFSNTATDINTKNSYSSGVRMSVNF